MVTRAKQNAASLQEVNEGILKMQNLCVTNSSKSDSSKIKATEPPVPGIALEIQKNPAVQENTDILKNDDLDSLLALDVGSVIVKASEGDVNLGIKGM